MAYVITEKCLEEQYAACVAVCPVDCIHPGDYNAKKFMIIDPDVCIECGLCLPECPVEAIVASEDDDATYAGINRELASQFKDNPAVTPRPVSDPPRRSDNKNVKG
jgi:ferredoxin